MIEQVADQIYRIPIRLPNNPLRELNSYLIRDESGSLLIDTGFRMGECREDLLAGLSEIGEPIEKLDIFLTHLHSDHSGLAPELIASGKKIYISEKDRQWIESSETVEQLRAVRNREFFEGGFPKEELLHIRDTNPALLYAPRFGCAQYCSVQNGDVIEYGGYRLRCVETPGHTPGHMCLWEEKCGILFSGDHVLFDITPNITSWPMLPDALGTYLTSLAVIRTLPVKSVFPGHRKTGNFQERIDALLQHHAERLNEVQEIVRKNPGEAAYKIASLMTWKIRAENWENFPQGQKYFAVGECIAHLDYLEKQKRICSELCSGKKIYYAVDEERKKASAD